MKLTSDKVRSTLQGLPEIQTLKVPFLITEFLKQQTECLLDNLRVLAFP